MKKALFDQDVILDVILQRTPFVKSSAAAIDLAARGRVQGFVSAHAVTTLYYHLSRALGKDAAIEPVRNLIQILEVAPVTHQVIQDAARQPGLDFEDAVTAFAAVHSAVEVIVSRDQRGFRGSPVPALTPETFLATN